MTSNIKLAPLEQVILAKLQENKESKEIEKELKICSGTLTSQIRRICKKYGVNSRYDLPGVEKKPSVFRQMILAKLQENKSGKEIAKELNVRKGTATSTIRRMCKKHGVNSSYDLAGVTRKLTRMQQGVMDLRNKKKSYTYIAFEFDVSESTIASICTKLRKRGYSVWGERVSKREDGGLSAHQQKIHDLLISGLTIQQIANRMGITRNCVYSHQHLIRKKLAASDPLSSD